MKIITLLMMTTSISVAQAEIYKCPGSVEGKFTYQERPCKGAKVDEHTLKTIPIDKQRIAEAQAKLARELDPEGTQKTEETSRETEAAAAPKTGSEPNSDMSSPPLVIEKPPTNPPPPTNASQKVLPTSSKDVLPKSVLPLPVSTPKVTTATVSVIPPKVVTTPAVSVTPVISTPKKK